MGEFDPPKMASFAPAGAPPAVAAAAVLAKSDVSDWVTDETPRVEGVDFNKGPPTLEELLGACVATGFQATNLGLAIDEINRMRAWRLSDVPVAADEDAALRDPAARAEVKATVFLGYTSNMISSGVRETIRFLVQHKMVDVIVTTAGGIEEDLMKCFNDTYIGDFALAGRALRAKGVNRIGNLLVPNDNYCAFEDWVKPLLHTMHDEQERDGVVWSPSKMIARFGREIDDERSVLYWAARNNVPVYCPAITDGSVGDMIYFHGYARPGFVVDIAQDIRGVNDRAVHAKATGMIILGGGVVKHHICNANLMRNGADFSVFINTGQEFDGSDSGARPDEAISWGKIKTTARPVKVYAEATIVFPLIVSQTFAKGFVPPAPGAAPPAGAPEPDDELDDPAAAWKKHICN